MTASAQVRLTCGPPRKNGDQPIRVATRFVGAGGWVVAVAVFDQAEVMIVPVSARTW